MPARDGRRAYVAFAVLVLAGELAGRWLLAAVPLPAGVVREHAALDVWPALVIIVKVATAAMLALIAFRATRTHRVVRRREAMIATLRTRTHRPGLTIGLSGRAWLVAFIGMSVLYLVPLDVDAPASGCWPLVSPWVHTQALPVFALIALLLSVTWRTLRSWLHALERYAADLLTLGHRRIAAIRTPHPAATATLPRSLFGGYFASRPPPVTA